MKEIAYFKLFLLGLTHHVFSTRIGVVMNLLNSSPAQHAISVILRLLPDHKEVYSHKIYK